VLEVEFDSASSAHYSSGEDVDGDEYDDDDDDISSTSLSSHRIHCIFMWLLFLIYADFTGVVMLLALLSALVISVCKHVFEFMNVQREFMAAATGKCTMTSSLPPTSVSQFISHTALIVTFDTYLETFVTSTFVVWEDGEFRFAVDRHVRAECSKDEYTHESLDSAERSDDNTYSSAKEPSPRQSEGSSISELRGRAFSNILKSDKYSKLCGLLLKNFGVVNANQVLDLNAMSLTMNNGAYETSPMLYLKDIQRVDDILERWLKEQKIERESPPQQQGNQVFMKTLLSVLEDASPEEYLAALDMTSATLTWTLSLLLNNPKASEIAQAEMDEVAESLNFLHNNAQLIHGAISPEESLDSAERSDDNTHSSAKEPSPRQSEGSSISELCGRAFSDILKSDKYSELCGLLLKNFGVVNANQVLDLNAMNLKMNNGAYETSPMLYLKDIQRPMNKIFKEVDDILERWLKEQKIKRESPPQQQGNQVFMKTLLSVLEDASPEEYVWIYGSDSFVQDTIFVMVVASIQYRAIADKESQTTNDKDDVSDDDEEAVDVNRKRGRADSKDLSATLDTKDREINDLNVKVVELSSVETFADWTISIFAIVFSDEEFPYSDAKPVFNREELVSLKREEYELDYKSSYLEVKYRKLMEQLGKSRETIEMLNSEIGKLNGKVKLQKKRATNTKENLNLAMTKGKSLVQQHDSLKQVIVGKTNGLIKFKAYVLPLEVLPDETEDSPMDDTVAQVPEPLDNKPKLNENKTRCSKKKQIEEREREIRATEERLLQIDVPRVADDFEKALRTINIREESEKLNV
ncbi:PHD finger protein EHD3, partial [Tanacetum coccineum]